MTLDTVCAIVAGAEDLMAKTESTASMDPLGDDDAEAQLREDRGKDAVEEELRHLIDDLTEDAQVDLVTLMWLGREDDETWDTLRQIAEDERGPSPADYLLGTPLLASYLMSGLDRLGLSCPSPTA